MLRYLRLARYIIKHEERLLVELLLARDPIGNPVTEWSSLHRLQGLFSLIVRTR